MGNLRLYGFNPLAAESADHALCMMQQRTDIRAVVTDVQMPGSMDGLALAHCLRATYPDLALIIMSGGCFPEAGELPVSARFFPKPFKTEDMSSALTMMIEGEACGRSGPGQQCSSGDPADY